jgi:hypothetical protein
VDGIHDRTTNPNECSGLGCQEGKGSKAAYGAVMKNYQ